jgi:hypothetical protein
MVTFFPVCLQAIILKLSPFTYELFRPMVLLRILLVKVMNSQTKFVSAGLIVIKNAMKFILAHELFKIEIISHPQLGSFMLLHHPPDLSGMIEVLSIPVGLHHGLHWLVIYF